MTRAVLSAAIDSEWSFVTGSRPCPICGADAGCSVHADDAFACCERQPSDWKLTNGAWLHRIQSGMRLASSVVVANGLDAPPIGNEIRI